MPRPQQPTDDEDRELPMEYVGRLAPNYYCRGWNGKRQKYCRARAGSKTEHPGTGRCNVHGGNAPVVHGQMRRYAGIATPRVRDLVEEHAAAPDPLDLLPELAMSRALLQDYLERKAEDDDGAALAEGVKLVGKIAGIVEGIERTKAQNAISLADLSRLMHNMGLAVRKHVTDPVIAERIQNEWDALRL